MRRAHLHLVEPVPEFRPRFLHVVVIGGFALVAGAALVAALLGAWR